MGARRCRHWSMARTFAARHTAGGSSTVVRTREALRKSLDVLEGVYVERRRGEVGDG
jgi:hypothetical protein